MTRFLETYTVNGKQPTRASARGAAFDNVLIARMSEIAADVTELSRLTGYPLDTHGSFRRRLANMVKAGQIDPKFAPSVAISTERSKNGGDPVEQAVELAPIPCRGPQDRGQNYDDLSTARLPPLASTCTIDEAIGAALGGERAPGYPLSGGDVCPQLFLSFPQGSMRDIPDSVPPAFRRKGVVGIDRESLFAELAVVRLFRRAGWDAYWRDNYQGRGWVADGDLCRNKRKRLPAESLGDAVVSCLNDAIGNDNLDGCWDVVAWNRNIVAFAECKRRQRDRLTRSQEAFLRVGLRTGLPRAAFVLVEWDMQ